MSPTRQRAVLFRSSSTFNTPTSEFYGKKDTIIQAYRFFQVLIPPLVEEDRLIDRSPPLCYQSKFFLNSPYQSNKQSTLCEEAAPRWTAWPDEKSMWRSFYSIPAEFSPPALVRDD
ncbi:hypothetical protein K443DRAFT_340218 [Laccaria amethystina LaAM-08-1]|uniref:Uncharacterized protein n=1 Tax=Laccaria amethystina LaAM-08-1 TaxID=1095629 RepID=A0A0C9WT60_9AGAR|nr:hypothetical protein K443DRAFT_340218 [Laccaria amethystina LaAM-08-1]